MTDNPYKRLALKLDALPNGFPPTADGAELRLLAKIFTPEQAALAAELRLTMETSEQIATRLGNSGEAPIDPAELQAMLKSMSRRGLIAAGRTDAGLGFGLLPFVVGIYEMQIDRIDEELAKLFEDYFHQEFSQTLVTEPAFHRVVPVDETVRMDMEVQPYESASQILDRAQAWGVFDCICRKQKALIGDPCEHPLDVCMSISSRPGAFDGNPVIRALTRDEAQETLRRAARAGLVHSVSNSQEGTWYICNCCTCSCGILRGMAELGIANVVARSPFVNLVDAELCMGCEDCIDFCQFDALTMEESIAVVQQARCVGCGVCVPVCPEEALSLRRRPEEEILPIPVTEHDWRMQRAAARHVDINRVL